ncbi:unnamed protein product [Rotaria magnacalcarata]|uniref:ADP ribosyltransferase domain-containing protein n=2 Tax=Rotaria magnacalcarata TaxID=392030 RepID=A0A816LRZ8_9BILA|nr:unnamed protein product [Rotaria magnacalcarata]
MNMSDATHLLKRITDLVHDGIMGNSVGESSLPSSTLTGYVERFSLVWLDAAINTSSIDRTLFLVTNTQTFERTDECVEHIRRSNHDCITLIVTAELGSTIIPLIHHLRQIRAIYLYNSDGENCEEWAFNYMKVKREVIQLDDLMAQMIAERWIRVKADEPLPITIVEISSTGIDGGFLHLQLLLDILVGIDSTSSGKKELLDFCRTVYKDDPLELDRLREFERDYDGGGALQWYTRESFVYRMLNKAFRTCDVDVLIHFRSVIRDIKCQLSKEQLSSPIRVYRAQLMSQEEIDTLKRSVNELISINSFFSSSIDRTYALFLLDSGASASLKRVLFEIEADPLLRNTKPFANISSYSSFPDEAEVLFMAGCIFRLVSVQEQNGINIVQLILCSEEENYLKELFKHVRQEIGEMNNLYTLGSLLFKSGKIHAAKKCLLQRLNELPDEHTDVAQCYHMLGNIMHECGEDDESRRMYNKALEINERTLPPNDPVIGNNHNNLGIVYMAKKDPKQALLHYEKALQIYKLAYGEEHERITISLDNIGIVYEDEKKYDEAIICF